MRSHLRRVNGDGNGFSVMPDHGETHPVEGLVAGGDQTHLGAPSELLERTPPDVGSDRSGGHRRRPRPAEASQVTCRRWPALGATGATCSPRRASSCPSRAGPATTKESA